MNSRKMIKLLEQDGWYLNSIKGSHHHFEHKIKKGKVTVPHPREELGHLEKLIRKQAGL
ncbi:type II toxin-antitoxin system HicA family toxin [Rodentibacter caecimuris]|uniref:type II toxin-antitoxin system HicA family toxin n=1 Tax=Rodentibacter caecimuris TaxID=1796644 RepID=UPI00211A2CA7|nr:type II toxin-antitoxin system HicA family toxin [Rodentibacter heylii]